MISFRFPPNSTRETLLLVPAEPEEREVFMTSVEGEVERESSYPELNFPHFELVTRIDSRASDKIAAALKLSQPTGGMLKLVTGPSAPETLAIALRHFDSPLALTENRLKRVLATLADRRNDVEKFRFLKLLETNGLLQAPLAAFYLRLGQWDPLLVLNTNVSIVVGILQDWEDWARSFVHFWDRLLAVPVPQCAHYLCVLTNSNLKQVIFEVCARFHLALPQHVLLQTLPHTIDAIASAVLKGRLDVSSAVKLLRQIYNPDHREIVRQALSSCTLSALALRAELAPAWGWGNIAVASNVTRLRLGCDLHGKLRFGHLKVQTATDVRHLRQNVLPSAPQVTVQFHTLNDPRFGPDGVSLLAFKVPNNAAIFHFFLSGPSKPPLSALLDLVRDLIRRPIITLTRHRLRKAFSFLVLEEPASICTITDNSLPAADGTADKACELVLGQKHCKAHYRNLYVDFSAVSHGAIDHIGADVYVIEKYFESRL